MAWWPISLKLELVRPRQEECWEMEASLGYSVSQNLKTKQKDTLFVKAGGLLGIGGQPGLQCISKLQNNRKELFSMSLIYKMG